MSQTLTIRHKLADVVVKAGDDVNQEQHQNSSSEFDSNFGVDFEELIFIRAKLASRAGKAADEVMWLKAAMRMACRYTHGRALILKRVCDLRPDSSSEFESVYAEIDFVEYAKLLETSKRHSDLAVFLSSIDKDYSQHFEMVGIRIKLVDYLIRDSESVTIAVVPFLQKELAEKLIDAKHTYTICVELLGAIRAVSPAAGDAEIKQIRKQCASRKHARLIKAMDAAHFV